jgi:hypothetical protein
MRDDLSSHQRPACHHLAVFDGSLLSHREALRWHGQRQLLTLIVRGAVQIQATNETETFRIGELMDNTETRRWISLMPRWSAWLSAQGMKRIFTLDDDFYIYRINGRDTFDVLSLDSA